jgi:hypothetical protein
MARFTIPQRNKKSAMRVINKKSLLAFFDFVDNELGLEFKDWKLMKGQHGMFVGSPNAPTYVDKNGKTVYPEYIRPAYDPDADSKRNADGEAYLKELLKTAEAEYETLAGGSEAAEPSPRGKKSGAGPIKPKAKAGDEDEACPF